MSALETVLPVVGTLLGAVVGAGGAYWGSSRESTTASLRNDYDDRRKTNERFAQAAVYMQRTLYRVASYYDIDDNDEKLSPEAAASIMAKAYTDRSIAWVTLSIYGTQELRDAASAWVEVLRRMRATIKNRQNDPPDGPSSASRADWAELVKQANDRRDKFIAQMRKDSPKR